MAKQEALKILTDHQKWRLGDDEVETTNPKELSTALDLATECLKSSSWRKVSEELPNNEQAVLVKDACGYYHTAMYNIHASEFYSSTVYELNYGEYLPIPNVVEWKPID